MTTSYILVTGGCGYIGSHVVVELLRAGYPVWIWDLVDRVELIRTAAANTTAEIRFSRVDLRELDHVCAEWNRIPSVLAIIHLAGLKSVSGSLKDPLSYYTTNIQGTLNLLSAVALLPPRVFLFSSSATVYSIEEERKEGLTEEADTSASALSPYGTTKKMLETILSDWSFVHRGRCLVRSLRYFNPIGALPELGFTILHGENILPILFSAAYEDRPFFILGNDYPTRDGTAERDYVHVSDIARGHVAILSHCIASPHVLPYDVFNLGSGCSVSVRELVGFAEQAINKKIHTQDMPRRPGDSARCFANINKIYTHIGWKPIQSDDLVSLLCDAWHAYGFFRAPLKQSLL